MNDSTLSALLTELLSLPKETEWVEFKENNGDPEAVGEYMSALANSAALHDKTFGYMAWGIRDESLEVVGTSFKPSSAKKGNEELENWLMRSLQPQINLKFFEFMYRGQAVVLFQIPAASHAPVRFGSEEFIRVGSYKKKLKDYPAKEAELWAKFSRRPFESGVAKGDVSGEEVLNLIDFTGCFDLLRIQLPGDQAGILARLTAEKLLATKPGGRFDILNLGAILFAKNLAAFDQIGRKALRVIKYKGNGRTETEREWRDAGSQRGYAVGFEMAVSYINSQLPHNEPIGQALRAEVKMYPERAIRELVANALIHQDFTITGTGPMVEIFSDRMEITNPGEPLVDPLRFIDTPPRSRNEGLAALMRRMGICEEGGTGIDKVVELAEVFQLPPPDFTVPQGFTRSTLFAPKKIGSMDASERIRACYQHACLCFVAAQKLTNASLRKRFAIEENNAGKATRIINETVKARLIKPFDPDTGRRYQSYVPFWA